MDLVNAQLRTVYFNNPAADLIATKVGVTSLPEAMSAMRPPGERHDNDHIDFRDVQVLPTPAELASEAESYLPPPEGSELIDNPEAALLDRHFRLLREDLIAPLRVELAEELSQPAGGRRLLFSNPTVVDIELKPEPHVTLSVDMPPQLLRRLRKLHTDKKAEELRSFFDTGAGRRVMPVGTLVMLLDSETDKDESIVAVGVVVARRDMLTFSEKRISSTFTEKMINSTLTIGIAWQGSSMDFILRALGSAQSAKRRNSRPCAAFLFSGRAIHSYKPVLEALQRMTSIALGHVLVRGGAPGVHTLAHAGMRLTDFSDEIRDAVANDLSQAEALELMMEKEVVLVQGPPGTGKTYIGVWMVKAMLEAQALKFPSGPPLRILCLCYTNHALDSFLESLIDAGAL
jgi:hypothetical protein